MFRLFAVIFLLGSSLTFATPSDRYGFLHLISYDHVKSLSAEERAQYISELRQFLVSQEKKQVGKAYGVNATDTIKDLMAQFFINEASAAQRGTVITPLNKAAVPDPVPETDRMVINVVASKETCAFDRDLNAAQKRLVQTNDRCVVGGYMICLSFNERGRFGCWKNEEYKKISQNNQCDSAKGEFSCAPPLYLNKNGGPLCVHSPGDAPVTVACEKAKEGMSPKELQKLVDKPEFKKQYRSLKEKLEDYCRNDGKDALVFDIGDCKSLNHRLAQIASPSKETSDGLICKETVQIGGEDVILSLKQGKEGMLSLIVGKKLAGWNVGRCGVNLKVKSSSENSPGHDYFESCLVKEDSEAGYTEVFAFKDGTCSIQHAYLTSAMPENIKSDACELNMLNPNRENGFTIHANGEKAQFKTDTGEESDFLKFDLEKSVQYTAGLEKNNFLNVYYSKASKLPSDRCWASEVTLIPGKVMTPVGITTRGAADSEEAGRAK